ncbi:MAG TPA: TPM domain-containing protein, partial [Planctomycetota bacterium]|nr:TPM domain-containing protein [Planctomycetota bacterium]
MFPLLLTAMLFSTAPPQDTVHYPPRPGPREFILDEAKLLSPQEAAEIRTLCDQALTAKKAPIIVVTIPSLATYGAGGWPIERYAMNLMGEWGVGWEEWNYGMLLLVSPGDRKARIELGGSWARRKDDAAQRVLSQQIIPHFKQGNFGIGIVEGVKGLHAIAMDVPSPALGMPVPAQTPPAAVPSLSVPSGGACWWLALPVIAILVFGVISRIGRGGVSSWG